MPARLSDRTFERLSIYRALLPGMLRKGTSRLFSHELAKSAGVTAAQVRRDMMAVGITGSPSKGYDILEMRDGIDSVLERFERVNVALIGLGNLGRAIVAYFQGRRSNLAIVATFDIVADRVGRVISGCRSYPMEELSERIRELKIQAAIIAVPVAAAQSVSEALVASGIRGMLNFAPIPLHVPPGVYVEQVDITTLMEKVAYFARQEA